MCIDKISGHFCRSSAQFMVSLAPVDKTKTIATKRQESELVEEKQGGQSTFLACENLLETFGNCFAASFASLTSNPTYFATLTRAEVKNRIKNCKCERDGKAKYWCNKMFQM